MNKIVSAAVATTVGAGLLFGLTACTDKASDDFKNRCDKVNGSVTRENDFQTLGAAPMSFVVKGGHGSSSKTSKSSKSKPSKSKSLLSGGKTKKTKKTKKFKHDDNDFLCVKNGNILFEEDE